MAQKETYLTPGGQKKLEEELEHLRGVRRQQVADRIQQAKEIGGTVDNAEYEEAKDEQAFVEGRIQTLEAMLTSAVTIPERRRSTSDVVELGSTVTVLLAKTGKQDKYTIVGSTEADPAKGLISNESPVGKALMGKRAGDEVEVEVPAGTQSMRLVKVR